MVAASANGSSMQDTYNRRCRSSSGGRPCRWLAPASGGRPRPGLQSKCGRSVLGWSKECQGEPCKSDAQHASTPGSATALTVVAGVVQAAYSCDVNYPGEEGKTKRRPGQCFVGGHLVDCWEVANLRQGRPSLYYLAECKARDLGKFRLPGHQRAEACKWGSGKQRILTTPGEGWTGRRAGAVQQRVSLLKDPMSCEHRWLYQTGRDVELGTKPLPFVPPTCLSQQMFLALKESGNAKYRVQPTNGRSQQLPPCMAHAAANSLHLHGWQQQPGRSTSTTASPVKGQLYTSPRMPAHQGGQL